MQMLAFHTLMSRCSDCSVQRFMEKSVTLLVNDMLGVAIQVDDPDILKG